MEPSSRFGLTIQHFAQGIGINVNGVSINISTAPSSSSTASSSALSLRNDGIEQESKEFEPQFQEKEMQLKQIFVDAFKNDSFKAIEPGLNLRKFTQLHPESASPFSPHDKRAARFYYQLKVTYETAQIFLSLQEAHQNSKVKDNWNSYSSAYKNIGKALNAMVEENEDLKSLLPPSFNSFISAQFKALENEYLESIREQEFDSPSEKDEIDKIAQKKYESLKNFLEKHPQCGDLPNPPPIDNCLECWTYPCRC